MLGLHVWLVDDSDMTRRLVRHQLVSLGCSVREFGCGAPAVAAMVRGDERPGLVLVDQDMPGATGCEVGAGLRSAGFAGTTVLLSGRVDEKLRVMARVAGLDGTLEKPTTAAMLRVLVEATGRRAVA